MLALLLLVITANLSSMAIVRERELGTLEQLNVTPLGRWELILGKLLPYALVGFVDVAARRGAWRCSGSRCRCAAASLLLLAGSLVYLLCTLGLGLFVSTISSTQQQAMMTATFFFLVPMIYLSGFIFPIENMPRVIQWVTTLIPLRYFLVIVRGIFLKGVGFDVLWPQFAALGAWGVTVLTLAAFVAEESIGTVTVAWDGGRRPRPEASVKPAMRVHVGTSGYNYPEWRGHVLSRGLAGRRRCSRTTPSGFRRSRSTTRSTGCRRAKTTTAWREQAPPGFTYTLKAPRRITHDQRLQGLRRHAARSSATPRACSGRTSAPLLFQLPPNFKCDLAAARGVPRRCCRRTSAPRSSSATTRG